VTKAQRKALERLATGVKLSFGSYGHYHGIRCTCPDWSDTSTLMPQILAWQTFRSLKKHGWIRRVESQRDTYEITDAGRAALQEDASV